MPDPSSLYPQPPQPNQGLFTGDPTRLLGAMNTINQLQRFGSEQNALGAYRNALGPNGADPAAVAEGLKRSGATFGAPEVMSSALAQRGQGIQNDTATFQQWALQNEYGRNLLSGLASDPKANAESVHNWATSVSRTADPRALPSSVINSVSKLLTSDPQGVPAAARKMQAQVAGAAASMGRETGPPDTSSGAPTSISSGQLHAQGASPTALPPGQPEYFAQSAAAGTSLLHSVQDIPNQKALLENIDALGREATSGPSADFEQRLNALAMRWLGHGITLTAGETAAGEGYNKLVNQIATAQAAASHATDSYLSAAFHANPNLSLSKQGREAMIPILKGNLDAQNFKANAFQQFMSGAEDGKQHDANEYLKWSGNFNKTLNPRVFQLQNMNGDQQAEYLRLLTPTDKRQLLSSFKLYESKGWIPKREQAQ